MTLVIVTALINIAVGAIVWQWYRTNKRIVNVWPQACDALGRQSAELEARTIIALGAPGWETTPDTMYPETRAEDLRRQLANLKNHDDERVKAAEAEVDAAREDPKSIPELKRRSATLALLMGTVCDAAQAAGTLKPVDGRFCDAVIDLRRKAVENEHAAKDLETERNRHAACLVLAEGGEIPTDMTQGMSAAMTAVQVLRKKWEQEKHGSNALLHIAMDCQKIASGGAYIDTDPEYRPAVLAVRKLRERCDAVTAAQGILPEKIDALGEVLGAAADDSWPEIVDKAAEQISGGNQIPDVGRETFRLRRDLDTISKIADGGIAPAYTAVPAERLCVSDYLQEHEAVEKVRNVVREAEKLRLPGEIGPAVDVLKRFSCTATSPSSARGEALCLRHGIQKRTRSPRFNILLTSRGDTLIPVIKAVREITGLGLKEAVDLTKSTPIVLVKDVGWKKAKEIEKQISDAGGTTELVQR